MKEEFKKIIITDPKVMMGKPIIAGTRLTVELILDKIAEGESINQIIESYPNLQQWYLSRMLFTL